VFSVINGGGDSKPRHAVTDLVALDRATTFTVTDTFLGHVTRTQYEVVRSDVMGGSATICVAWPGQESRDRVPDAALDTVIAALEQVRRVRDRPRVAFAEPLVEDEPNDDAGPSQARGHAAVETLRGTVAGHDVADELDALRGDLTDDGPVAA
jgi:hypothetical protein